jgi:hypothetical protein
MPIANCPAMMTSHHSRSVHDTSGPRGLRWVFLRGSQAVTCEVRVCGRQTYDVCVVPHWDVSSSAIETFNRPAAALRRHAEIAWYFRQAGWILAREGGRNATAIAAA